MTSPSDALPPPPAWLRRLRDDPGARTLAIVLILAAAVRLGIVIASIGSDDAMWWERFARTIGRHGLLTTYEQLRMFNHTPLMGLLASGAASLADALGIRFAIVFKLPIVVASVATCWLLARVSPLRTAALLWIALQPADVLVSAYHANVDSLCVAFGFASAFLLERGRPGAAGLALAAAINVKLPAVLLIGPFLLRASTAPAGRRFALGLSAGVLPFVPVLIGAGEAFVRNAILYSSFPGPWGFGLFRHFAASRMPGLAGVLGEGLLPAGKWIILGASIAVGWIGRRRVRWSAYDMGAIVFAVFLVFAPGFGVQYVVYPLPFLFAARFRTGSEYAALAGLFAALVYASLWTGDFPLRSEFKSGIPMPVLLVGFLSWYVLARYLIGETAGLLRRAPDTKRYRRPVS